MLLFRGKDYAEIGSKKSLIAKFYCCISRVSIKQIAGINQITVEEKCPKNEQLKFTKWEKILYTKYQIIFFSRYFV